MYLRTFSASLAAFVIAACSVAETPEPEGETVECAIGAGAGLANVCTLEWANGVEGGEFLIHHPEGGFRRFAVNEDASGVTALDGALDVVMLEPAPGDLWQFEVDGDRYVMAPPPPSGA